jgi:uncharacterized metal-binding protein YceD (DUF177 family)
LTEALEGPLLSAEGQLRVSSLQKGGRVDVRVTGRAVAQRACDRCSEAVELSVETDEQLLYFPEEDQRSVQVGELELKSEDLEVGWYRGGVLDLADVVREAFALAVPPRCVCVDEVACEARTQRLLGLAGAAGAHGPFAGLGRLR